LDVELLRRYSNHGHLVKPLVRLLEEHGAGTADEEEPSRARTTRSEATTVRQKQRRLSREEIAKLISRYEGGALMKELAAEFDIERRTVSAILRREDVMLRSRGLSSEQIDEAVRLYELGWSLARIGDKLGVDHETVRQRLKERGVRMRDAQRRELPQPM
jgi:DNA-directed RNA polymerase specialized sigma24 family protein